MTLNADSIKIDTDDGRFVLVIDTEEFGVMRVNFHNIALEFEDEVRKELRPYALEAGHARAAVAAGIGLDDYIGRTHDDGPDYDLARDLARGK